MDKRSLFGIIACLVFFLAYQQYLKNKYPNMGQPQTTEQAAQQPGATTPGAAAPGVAAPAPGAMPAPAPTATAVEKLPVDQLTLETDAAIFRFSQETGGLDAVMLKGYKKEATAEGHANVIDSPFTLQGVIGANAPTPTSLPLFAAERQGRTIRFSRDQDGVRIAQEYTVPETGYGIDANVTFTNTTAAALDLTTGVLAAETVTMKKPAKMLGLIPGGAVEMQRLVSKVAGSEEDYDLHKHCDDPEPLRLTSASIDYMGIDKHYFEGVLLPKFKQANVRAEYQPLGKEVCRVTFAMFEPQGQVAAGAAVSMPLRAYFGPKDLGVLKAYDERLESTVAFGTFGFIARPLLIVIQGFYGFFKNYGVAIILLTICLKILFYPLMKASAVSMHKMKALNPQMKAIQEKYKDDRQRLNQELMKFYSVHKINPMKGCLPVLPQIPVFFAFYQVLGNAIELRHAPFFGWIQDLSAMDPYFITPLLLGVAMFIQQKLTPTTGMDKTQEKILLFMPIMFTAMMVTLPAGLTLYMLTNTVTGIAQQRWLYRKLDQTAPQSKGAAVSGRVAKAKA